MALKKFIDDVSVLAVEQCLVRRLPLVLSSDLICDLSDDDVQRLAVESPDIAPERMRMTEKLRILQEGLTQLTRLDSSSLVSEQLKKPCAEPFPVSACMKINYSLAYFRLDAQTPLSSHC